MNQLLTNCCCFQIVENTEWYWNEKAFCRSCKFSAKTYVGPTSHGGRTALNCLDWLHPQSGNLTKKRKLKYTSFVFSWPITKQHLKALLKFSTLVTDKQNTTDRSRLLKMIHGYLREFAIHYSSGRDLENHCTALLNKARPSREIYSFLRDEVRGQDGITSHSLNCIPLCPSLVLILARAYEALSGWGSGKVFLDIIFKIQENLLIMIFNSI